MADALITQCRTDHLRAFDLINGTAMDAVRGAFAVALDDSALDQDRATCDPAAEMPFSYRRDANGAR
jgi:hypothetical protein